MLQPPPSTAVAAIRAAATPATVDFPSEESNYIATAVIFWRGLLILQQQQQSSSPVGHRHTREGERRCNFRSEDVPGLGLLHEVFTGGSVRAEPG